MNASRALAAESFLSLTGIVVQELAGSSPEERTLPRPRRIFAVFAFFGLLSVAAELGEGPARFATAAGAVVTLGALLYGASGRGLISLLTWAGRSVGGGVSQPAGASLASYQANAYQGPFANDVASSVPSSHTQVV